MREIGLESGLEFGEIDYEETTIYERADRVCFEVSGVGHGQSTAGATCAYSERRSEYALNHA